MELAATDGADPFGAARSHHPRRSRADQDAFLAPFRVLDCDAAAADCYANARAHLAAKGQSIGDRDLMIAAIAVANRLTVVTLVQAPVSQASAAGQSTIRTGDST